jgi:hypothetical protein
MLCYAMPHSPSSTVSCFATGMMPMMVAVQPPKATKPSSVPPATRRSFGAWGSSSQSARLSLRMQTCEEAAPRPPAPHRARARACKAGRCSRVSALLQGQCSAACAMQSSDRQAERPADRRTDAGTNGRTDCTSASTCTGAAHVSDGTWSRCTSSKKLPCMARHTAGQTPPESGTSF